MADTPTPRIKRRYYTPKEVAEECNCSLSNVYAKMASGEILCISSFGPKRVPREWLDAELAERERRRKEETAIDPAVKQKGRK